MASTIVRCLVFSVLLEISVTGSSPAQTPGAVESKAVAAGQPGILNRRYDIGEKLKYHMKGSNRGRQGTTTYEAEANGEVKKDAAGNFVEEYAWSNLMVNDKPAALSAAAKAFRQIVSLDPGVAPAVPNLSQVIPLVGPITDLLTFYSDLWLANRLG